MLGILYFIFLFFIHFVNKFAKLSFHGNTDFQMYLPDPEALIIYAKSLKLNALCNLEQAAQRLLSFFMSFVILTNECFSFNVQIKNKNLKVTCP